MTPRQIFLPGIVLLLAGCSTRPAAPPPAEHTVSSDYHLIMGELALARGQDEVALQEYRAASMRREDPGIARRATLIALLAGDHAAARAAADRWEQLAPADLEAAQYQAILHARSGENAAALGYLLRIADGGTAAARGANLQAVTTVLAREPNPWRSADLMAAVAAARPAPAEGWHGAALLALAADRPARAAEFAERALARDPAQVDARFLLAQAKLLAHPSRSGDDALAPLAGFRDSDDPGLRYRFAGLLVLAGRVAEADALLEDILLATPDQHDARMARALLAIESGRHETAEAELHRLLRRHGHMQDAFYYLGVLAERRGTLDEALDWYGHVSPEGPRWADAQLGIGRALIALEGPDEAAAFFVELRVRWPGLETFLALNEAALLTSNGFAARSLALLDEVQPGTGAERAEFDWQLAVAAAEAGETDRAEAAFRRLLARDPGNPSVQNALGAVLAEANRLDEAEPLLEAALRAAPANPAILDSMGWLRVRQGNPAAARPLLEESWRREPSPAAGEHLMAALRALGDMQSLERLRKALDARFPGLLNNEDPS